VPWKERCDAGREIREERDRGKKKDRRRERYKKGASELANFLTLPRLIFLNFLGAGDGVTRP